MNPRESIFKQKFSAAAKQLGTKTESLLSLKIRSCVPHQEYEFLTDALRKGSGLKYTEIRTPDLQGKGYLLDNGQEKLVIVEHETGLEIIFEHVANVCPDVKTTVELLANISQIFSLPVSLVALVLQIWSACGGMRRSEAIEFRQIDGNGRLHEKHHSPDSGANRCQWMDSTGPNIAIISELLENKVNSLSNVIHAIIIRIDMLEKKILVKKQNKKQS